MEHSLAMCVIRKNLKNKILIGFRDLAPEEDTKAWPGKRGFFGSGISRGIHPLFVCPGAGGRRMSLSHNKIATTMGG
jgi:hypothetical protein